MCRTQPYRLIGLVGMDPTLQSRSLTVDIAGPKGSKTRILEGVSLDVSAGQLCAVVGPSGSGKSTLLHALSGLERATSGEVQVLGQRLGDLSNRDLAKFQRDRIGFVFQQFNLVGSLTALENVLLPQRLRGVSVTKGDALKVLEQLGVADQAQTRAALLSSGQQQRVAIARVLLKSPEVVFADEPTGALDSHSAEIVQRHLSNLAEQGATVILVTHDLNAAARSDIAYVLRDGLISARIDSPTSEQLLQSASATRKTE